MAKLVAGIGDKGDVVISMKNSHGETVKTPLYSTWADAMRFFKNNPQVKFDKRIAHFPTWQQHVLSQGWVRTKKIIRQVSLSVKPVDENFRVDLEDYIVVDRDHRGLFANPRNKRELPFWVTKQRDSHNYRANVNFMNMELFRKEGNHETKYIYLPTPEQCHFWAMRTRIESMSLLLEEYSPYGETAVTHRAIVKHLELLQSCLDNRNIFAPYIKPQKDLEACQLESTALT